MGNQTSCVAASPGLPFDYAITNGFDTFEWFPDKKEWGQGWLEDDISQTERTNIKERAKQRELMLSVHAPLVVNPLRGETYHAFLKTVDFARDIGAILINIHLFTEEGIERYVQALQPYIKHTAQLNLKLSIENTPETSPHDFNRLFEHIKKLNHTPINHVGMCFDIGHANLFHETRNDYIRYLNTIDMSVPIIHIHMHENYGDYDRHMPIFTGPAGDNPAGITAFISTMKRRSFAGSIILEQWPDQPHLLNNGRQRLLSIYKEI
ncbi:MAG: TIM barrel protein [Nitrospirae bacterium]|nr:TIM barrel protein [Nitrospirota bacterium]